MSVAIFGRVQKRYSLKIATVLAAVFVVMVVTAVIFALHIAAGPAEAATDRGIAALAGLLVLLLFNLGLVGIVLGGNVALSLRRLSERAEHIGQGEFDVDISTNRSDELGDLYGSIALMRDELAAMVTNLEETHEQIEAERKRATEAKEEAQRLQRETETQNEQLLELAERFSVAMEAAAAGDLTGRLDVETDDQALQSIADAYNEMVVELGEAVAQAQQSATHIDEMSGDLDNAGQEIRRGSQDVAETINSIATGAEQQAEELQTAAGEIGRLSAATQEVASTTTEIASQSEVVATSADEGRNSAATTVELMQETVGRTENVVKTVDELVEEARQIEQVITTIDDIADQINMLALNANIEAARVGTNGSGTDGDGFAVVASEVKQLAGETMDAVENIERTLQRVQGRAEETADDITAVDESVRTAAHDVDDLKDELDTITRQITTVDTSIQDITQTANQQAETAQEIATIVDSVADIAEETSARTENVSATSEEVTASTENVADLAEDLDTEAAGLSHMMRSFTVTRQESLSVGGD